MSDPSTPSHPAHTHTVRPRWTWLALVVLVAGLVALGIGVALQSWTWAIVGIALLVVGAGLGLYGGFFYDIQGGAVSTQLGEAVRGEEFESPAPGQRWSEEEVREDVRSRWLDDESGDSRGQGF
jgi:hypothetical protein